ncbi:MAG: DedD protein [Pseudomonadota bacterium]|jgi:DedD protein|nr:DedD protein [Pseudomonadota bacterium]MDQ5942119.1 DedD protein [Pseudomonadota bacterium]
MSMPEADAQLPLKKRARRRLVGAIALAVLAAVVLPMVMDQTPQMPVQDVQIRIPGQDQVPAFQPKALAGKGQEAPAAKAATPEKPVVAAPSEKEVAKPAEKSAEKPVEKTSEKSAEKPTEKTAAKPDKKSAEKTPEKAPASNEKDPKAATKNGDDSQRAAAILSGKPAAEPSAAAKSGAAATGEYVILIGAFANPANVKQLQGKLGELNIKVYTETLDSPQGKKTRVRAGPFASRDAADKALEKMKRIGVNGVVAAKQ